LRNNGTARVMLERAVTLDPNAVWAWSRLGWVENYSDRPERAVAHFERALRLSPLDPMNFNNYVGLGLPATSQSVTTTPSRSIGVHCRSGRRPIGFCAAWWGPWPVPGAWMRRRSSSSV
jgi:tetratricopeptide (TPR) repeat protein